MKRPVETCLPPRIEALGLLHIWSNKEIILLSLFTGGRSEASQWGRCRPATISTLLTSKAGRMVRGTLDRRLLFKVKFETHNCFCTTFCTTCLPFQQTSSLVGSPSVGEQFGCCCKQLNQERPGVGRQTSFALHLGYSARVLCTTTLTASWEKGTRGI